MPRLDNNGFVMLAEALHLQSGGMNVVRCASWYDLYNLKNVKNSHGGVLLLVKLQTEASNLTKSNTPSWLFFMFFKLCK